MSDNQNWNKMGEEIKDALSQALRSGDFTNLNELVSQSVVNTLNEVGKHIPFVDNSSQGSYGNRSSNGSQDNSGNQGGAGRQAGQGGYGGANSAGRQSGPSAQGPGSYSGSWTEPGSQTETGTWQNQIRERIEQERQRQQQNWQRHLQRTQAQERKRGRQHPGQQAQQRQVPMRDKRAPALSLREFKRVGSVSNVLYQVFGGIGLGTTLLVAFILLMMWVAGLETSGAGWLVNFIFQLGFLYMIRLGILQRKRLQRAERYIRICGQNKFTTIENLAHSTGKKVRGVLKDLRKMLALGMFPEGHLDERKTCFMLNDEVYRQYQDAEKGRLLREAEQRKPPETAGDAGLSEQTADADPSGRQEAHGGQGVYGGQKISPEMERELNTMVAEGMECVGRLRELNHQIPGEIISDKLSRLENLLKDIFESVREHPEQMHRMHKLMDYYLPTTLKLVEAYGEFDRVNAPGDDILKAKAEIENTLDTINQAFAELLNNLFQDAVLDATTDAQVLKTMLAREGLMREMDFQTDESKT